MVLFDRSWYNRAGVEKVMGFCTEDQYYEFLRSVPIFESLLQRSGIILLKYWFSVSPEEQMNRLRRRYELAHKRWKLSPTDIDSLDKWTDYSKAKDNMFIYTNTTRCPWTVIPSDSKRHAQIDCIYDILKKIPFETIPPEEIKFPKKRIIEENYVRMPIDEIPFANEYHSTFLGKKPKEKPKKAKKSKK